MPIPVNYEQDQKRKRLSQEEIKKLIDWTRNNSLDSVKDAKLRYEKNMLRVIGRMKKEAFGGKQEV